MFVGSSITPENQRRDLVIPCKNSKPGTPCLRMGTAVNVIARLRPGVSTQVAREEMQGIESRIVARSPQMGEYKRGRTLRLLPLRDKLVETSRPGPARAARRRRIRVADRMRQRREFTARPRRGAPAGNLDSNRAGRGALARRPPTSHREPRARASGRRRRASCSRAGRFNSSRASGLPMFPGSTNFPSTPACFCSHWQPHSSPESFSEPALL